MYHYQVEFENLYYDIMNLLGSRLLFVRVWKANHVVLVSLIQDSFKPGKSRQDDLQSGKFKNRRLGRFFSSGYQCPSLGVCCPGEASKGHPCNPWVVFRILRSSPSRNGIEHHWIHLAVWIYDKLLRNIYYLYVYQTATTIWLLFCVSWNIGIDCMYQYVVCKL